MATAPSPNDLTRQQLDELDALLQRMLALPLDPPPPGGVGEPRVPDMAAPNWRVDPPAPIPVPAPRLFTPPPPADPPRPRAAEPEPLPSPVFRAPPPVPDEPPPRPSRPTPAVAPAVPPPEPAVPVVEKRAVPAPAVERAPAPSPERRRESASPASGASPSEGVPDRSPPGPPVPVALWPLVAFNWTVDTLLGWSGPPGWFLRSGFGKNLLGLTGIGLLLYTAAHVASLQGLVTLPFPLPWPR